MKKNRLQDCPDRVGTLSRLKKLELDGENRRKGAARRLKNRTPALTEGHSNQDQKWF